MKNESIHEFYICNGEIIESAQNHNFDKIKGSIVYEVIRVFNGVPIYLREHIIRMSRSIELTGFDFISSEEEITSSINKLIGLNKVLNCNLKLLYSNFDNDKYQLLAYFIKSNYPTQEDYANGVKVIFFESERNNPNAKNCR